MTRLSDEIEAKLRAKAGAGTKAQMEKYFLGAVQFIGVKRAGVDAVFKSVQVPEDVDEAVAEAWALLASPYMEMRQVGIEFLTKKRKKLKDDIIDDVAAYFDEHVNDWATCDGLCSRVLREMIKRGPAVKKRVMEWSKAENKWRQRASAVAFVNEAKSGAYDDDVIAVCGRIVKNPERFVQLGCGWALREVSRSDRARVIAFIEDNAKHMSREGLRYAVEKMPPAVRAEVMSRHAELTGRLAVRGRASAGRRRPRSA